MNLFYRKYGQGPTLIIVHGLYGASDNWVKIGKMLGEYFEVYIVDQRNHGRSPHHSEHNYHEMRSDLLEFMDYHSIDKALLLGHSMGGKTVMFFANEHPERVNGLIVVDVAPKSYAISAKSLKKTIDHHTIISAMKSVDFSIAKTRNDVEDSLKAYISSGRIRQFLMKNLQRNKDQSFNWSLNLNALQSNLDEILNGMDEKEFEKGNSIIGFPVLFIKGANSNYILDSDSALINKIFPYAEIITIEDSGHWLHVEKPDLLFESIIDFFL